MWLHDARSGEWFESKGCVNTDGSPLSSINDLGNSFDVFPRRDYLCVSVNDLAAFYDKNDVTKLIAELTAIRDGLGEPGKHPLDDEEVADVYGPEEPEVGG